MDKQLERWIEELEKIEQEELGKMLLIGGREARFIVGKSMADLNRQCYEQELEMISMPQLFKKRVENGIDSDLGRLLWKYDILTGSNLGRVEYKERDYGLFTHLNIFGTEENKIQAYQRPLRTGGIEVASDEIDRALSMEDGINVIITPFQTIRNSPRGKISLRDILKGDGHAVAKGASGNDLELLEQYLMDYLKIMKKSPFNPLEMGIWFSEDAGINTMRPFELGDSGIGIYNRNLTNKEYRTLALRK